MNATLGDQYSTGLSRPNIERALTAAGKDLDHLVAADLAMLEDFHTMGRLATAGLVELLDIDSGTRVLDAGSGIGGTARYIAERYGCTVTAADLTEDYCDTHRWLNRLVGLADRISVAQADVTDLRWEDNSFDVVISQHVQMNVADKGRLYAEARRVLADGGRLGLWDIVAGGGGQLDYPLPWADRSDRSHLVTSAQLRTTVESAGLTVVHWNDLSEPAVALMQTVLARPSGPIGLKAFVPDFERKATNLTAGLADGRLRAVQGVATLSGK